MPQNDERRFLNFTLLRRISQKLKEAGRDLLPIFLVVCFFQLAVLRQPFPELLEILIGTAFVVVGLMLFVQGLEMGLFPIGEALAVAFARKGSLIWLLIFAFTPIDFAIILIFLYIAAESNGYLLQAIISRISIKHRGKVFGLHMWIDRLGRVIGPLIGGVLWVTLGDSIPFIISVYLGLGLIPLFMLAIRMLSSFMVEQVDIDKIGVIKIKK